MKKIFITAGLVASAAAFAQTGKVGVNETAPQATLDIKPNAANLAGTTNEGLLIPRLTAARVSAIPVASRVEGTLVYVTDAPSGALFSDTTKGYYYYDAAATKWVKVGSGSAAAPTVTTAQNGLSMNGTAVELGGTLTKDTDIFQTGHSLTTSGAGNVGFGVSNPTEKLVVNGAIVSGPTKNALPGGNFSGGFYETIANGTSIYPFTDSANLVIEGYHDTGNYRDIVFTTGPNAGQAVRMSISRDGGVSIGPNHYTTNAPANLSLDLQETNKGLKLNNVALTSTTAVAPLANHIAGTVVYNTATAGDVTPGIYYNDGTKWNRANSGASAGAVTASNGLTATASNVALGGTLTQATTVDQANNNMTFTTGTGRFIVNGTQQNNGAMYVQNVRTEAGSSVAYTSSDYMIVVTNPAISGNLLLPSASANPGRIIFISNGTTSGLNFSGSGTADTLPYNFSVLSVKSGSGFVSNGTTWYPLGR